MTSGSQDLLHLCDINKRSRIFTCGHGGSDAGKDKEKGGDEFDNEGFDAVRLSHLVMVPYVNLPHGYRMDLKF